MPWINANSLAKYFTNFEHLEFCHSFYRWWQLTTSMQFFSQLLFYRLNNKYKELWSIRFEPITFNTWIRLIAMYSFTPNKTLATNDTEIKSFQNINNAASKLYIPATKEKSIVYLWFVMHCNNFDIDFIPMDCDSVKFILRLSFLFSVSFEYQYTKGYITYEKWIYFTHSAERNNLASSRSRVVLMTTDFSECWFKDK